MSKVSGSYASVNRGVSQQVPEERLDGQHAEQINMLSDPVAGLARRRGTQFLLESSILSGAAAAATLTDLHGARGFDYALSGKDYSVLYRPAAKASGSAAPALLVYNKTDNAAVPLVTDAGADTLLANGVSAVAQVGRYLLLASKGFLTTSTTADLFGVTANKRYGVVWVRGGAYSRTFTVTVKRTAGTTTVSYTTPASSYQTPLSTSDILASDPEYQKKVNDRVNAYNSSVTQWIGTASAAVQPSAIAEELRILLAAQGLTVARSGAAIQIDHADLEGVSVTEGGDGTLMRAVHQEVPEAALVSNFHFVGKVVKVQAKGSTAAYYLKAVPRVAGLTGWQEVTWEEGTATSFAAGTFFAVGTVEAGTLYVSSTPAGLTTLAPAVVTPSVVARTVGDADTNPAPYFVGKAITYLGTFQDRLVVGSGAVLNMSRTGDYFNFFRETVLTVVDSDPVEAFALGAEDDVLRTSRIFDKSLLLFGDKAQYTVSGRVPITPKTSTIVQSSAHTGTTDSPPLVNGDLVFYGTVREGASQLHQFSLGNVEDTSHSTEVTQQLSTYISGTPTELVGMTSPDMLFLRTDVDGSLYTFRYLDAEGGAKRLLDSWSRWTFAPACGRLIGVSPHKGQLLLYFIRSGTDRGGATRTWLVVDRASLRAGVDTRPYLDSMRAHNAVTAGAATDSWHPSTTGVNLAFDTTTTAGLQGTTTLGGATALLAEFPQATAASLWVGVPFEGSVELTNPFTRDRNDNVVTTGKLTVSRLDVSFNSTGGFYADVVTNYSNTRNLSFNGRILGAANNLIGQQPVSKGSVPVFIGRETREYTLTLRTKTWLPFAVTALEWTGQYFYNVRR